MTKVTDEYGFITVESLLSEAMDYVPICDVVESCEDCPRYADDCDGEVEDD